MPCSSDGYPRLSDEERNSPPILCGVFSALEKEGKLMQVLAKVDWKEVGITTEWALGWWAQHKANDAERRAREAAEAARKETAQQALGKLSPQERAALGIRG